MDIVTRVQGILLKPKEEWEKIKGESIPISKLFTSYAILLALIPPIARFIRFSLFGRRVSYEGFIQIGTGRILFYSIFMFIFYLAVVYLIGYIINALAPTFSSKQNLENAMKLAVFSMTPVWLAGILNIIPYLGWLSILASLYGVYLFYLGFTNPLMDTPEDKVGGYFIVSIVVAIVLVGVASAVLSAIFLVGAIARF